MDLCVYIVHMCVLKSKSMTSHECYVTRKFPSFAVPRPVTSGVVKERRKERDTMEVAQ